MPVHPDAPDVGGERASLERSLVATIDAPDPAVGITSVVPARVLETRSGAGLSTADGRFQGSGAVDAGGLVQLDVLGRGGVPATGVAAVMLNVTAVAPVGPGFLTVYPCGDDRPTASNVNYAPGDVVANAVLAQVGTGGRVCLFTLAETHLVVDVNGYVPTSKSPTAVVPARLVETRNGPDDHTVDGQLAGIGAMAAGSTLAVDVLGRGGVPDADVGAVLLNVTAVGPLAPGFLTVFPCGADRPTASNVNYGPGDVVPNMVLAKLGTDGRVCIFSHAATHLVVDVNGFVETGRAPYSLVPTRLLETRRGPGDVTIDRRFQGGGPVGPMGTITLDVVGRGGLPGDDVEAVMLNVTAVNPSGPGFVTVYPCDAPRPNASNLNYVAGDVVPNAVLVKLSSAGTICLYSYAATDLVVDLAGYVRTIIDDELVLDPSEVATVSNNGNGTAKISLTAGTEVPAVGSFLAVSNSAALPGGAYVKVIATNGSALTVEPAGLGDVFPDVFLDQHVGSGDVGAVTSGHGLTEGLGGILSPAAWDCGVASWSGIWNETQPLSVSIQDLEFDHTFFPPAPGFLGYLGISMRGTFVFDLGITSSEGYSCELDTQYRRLNRLLDLTLPLPGNVTLFVNIEPVFEVSASISGRIGYQISRQFYTYVSINEGDLASGLSSANTSEGFEASASMSASGFVGGELGVSVGAGNKLFGVSAGLSGRFGPQVDVSVSTENPACVTVESSLTFAASARFEAWLGAWGDRYNAKLGDISGVKRPLLGSPFCLGDGPPVGPYCTSNSDVSAAECDALVELYYATDGPTSWYNIDGWDTDRHPCTWFGVTCTDGELTGLKLQSNGLSGPIPASIGRLHNLTSLLMGNNDIWELPSSIGNLSELTVMAFGVTGVLSGPVPSWIGNLTKLERLGFGGAGFSGPFPAAVRNLTSLRELSLWQNNLSGPIPEWIGELTTLELLSMSNNDLSGVVPSSIRNLTNLQPNYLELWGNGCFTADAATTAFVESFDPYWNDGCD